MIGPDGESVTRRRPPGGQRNQLLNRAASRLDSSWILFALLALIAFFAVTHYGQFVTPYNARSIAVDASTILVLAVGQTFVIITAGIDLSVSAVLVFSGVMSALAMDAMGGVKAGWVAILIGVCVALASGLLWGLFNGIAIATLKIPPLIVTLGSLGMALGVAELAINGIDVTTIPNALQEDVGFRTIVGVPVLVLIALVVTALGGALLHMTSFGRHTYAVGSNMEAARRVGLRVNRQLAMVYALQGVLGGLAGIMSLSRYGSTLIAGHSQANLVVITGVVLGGTSLFGGVGIMFGTLIGVLLPVVLQNGLVIMGVQAFWQEVAIGAVLIVAVYVDQLRRKRRQREP